MLHPVSYDELLVDFYSNLDETAADLLKCIDPVTKEMRIFDVRISPMLSRYIASYPLPCASPLWVNTFTSEINHRSWKRRRSHYDIWVSGFNSTTENDLLEPLYITLEDQFKYEEYGALSIRCSTKTFCKGKSMSDLISGRLRAIASTKNRVPLLAEFVQAIDTVSYDRIYLNGEVCIENDFMRFAMHIIDSSCENQGELLRQQISSIHFRFPRLAHGLQMKMKAYVNRADIRAYYTDKDAVRHFCGSILQRLLMGSMAQRLRFSKQSRWIPAKYKNILDDKFVVKSEQAAFIVKCDVSSFTNSSINTWVMVFTYILILSYNDSVKHLNKPFNVRVKDAFCTVTIIEVLMCYFVLTLGAVASTERGSYVAPGGYLGVKANMVLTSQYFGLYMEEVAGKARTLFPTCTLSGQLGGDDAYFRVVGHKTECQELLAYLHNEISMYVGRLKEYVIEELSSDMEFVSKTGFCKKRVFISTTNVTEDGNYNVRVRSMEKLPLMGELLEKIPLVKKAAKLRAYATFMTQIRRLLTGYENEGRLRDLYSFAWTNFYNLIPIGSTKRSLLCVDDIDLRWIDNYTVVTHDLYHFLLTIIPIPSMSVSPANATLRERLNCLVSTKRVTSVEFWQGEDRVHDSRLKVYGFQKALRKYDKLMLVNEIDRREWNSHVDLFVSNLVAFRTSIDGLL